MNFYRRARRIAGKVARTIPWFRRQREISCDYKLITSHEASVMRAAGWLSPLTAHRQQRAYADLMEKMRAGDVRIDLGVAAGAVDALGRPAVSLLEVGCGGGYYSEVFSRLPATKVDYTGLDYSAAMVAQSKASYPGVNFMTGDATALQFSDAAFDVVFNGVSLMHIPNYAAAIAESARVARIACIFHSVPVVLNHSTAHLSKYAYGGKVVEVVFNRAALLEEFHRAGLAVDRSWRTIPYDVGHVLGESSWAETFLCTKLA
jgi:ubiquinone/menaquinone biosynthesis C-methylase UbiE